MLGSIVNLAYLFGATSFVWGLRQMSTHQIPLKKVIY